MRGSYRYMVVVVGLVFLALAVYFVLSSGIGISSIRSQVSNQSWDAAAGGVSYKLAAIVAIIVCLAVRYVSRVPPVHGE